MRQLVHQCLAEEASNKVKWIARPWQQDFNASWKSWWQEEPLGCSRSSSFPNETAPPLPQAMRTGPCRALPNDFRRERFTGFGFRMLRGARPTIRLWSLIVAYRQSRSAGGGRATHAYACRGSINRGASRDCPAGSCLLLLSVAPVAVRDSHS